MSQRNPERDLQGTALADLRHVGMCRRGAHHHGCRSKQEAGKATESPNRGQPNTGIHENLLAKKMSEPMHTKAGTASARKAANGGRPTYYSCTRRDSRYVLIDQTASWVSTPSNGGM